MLDLPGFDVSALLAEDPQTQLYRARRTADGRPVLLKWLRPSAATPVRKARLRFEFEMMRGLTLPGVPRVHRLLPHQQSLAFSMDDDGGRMLAACLHAEAPSLPAVLRLMLGLAGVLGDLHAHHIIHKNINPSSLLVDLEAGRVQVIDFSVASALSREDTPTQSPEALEGTLAYMAPEQTGRMNRTLDYRADFYAAGITFYELLTGRRPFEASDALGLVHAHIAQRPPAPHAVQPEVPEAVSAIVLKLLAKAAEDRYQSARGLQADLQRCLDALEAGDALAPFPVGQHDETEVLRIPQKLYGRAEQVAHLMAAFDRASHGATEMLLVAGAPGIGKSALVHEVHKPIVRARGYFVSGKFDQYQRNVPYSALIQAFEQLAEQLLTESAERVAAWREALHEALGPNTRLLCDFVPGFARVLGPQPPVPTLAPTEAQNRFNLTLRAFVRVIATAEHPLVIFLDDLQWADAATLGVMGALPPQQEDRHLLFIGAYRDSEVGPAHPLRLTVQQLEAMGARLTTLTLEPLPAATVAELLGDALRADPSTCRDLAALVTRKTRGNPFFLRQFLMALHEKGLIRYDPQARAWTQDLARIEQEQMTDNVVALMVEQLQGLPEATRHTLQHAACIGNRFELGMVAVVSEQDLAEAASALWPAVEAGLVLPVGDAYKLLPSWQADVPLEAPAEVVEVAYRFLHDRVQQAAYSLIADDLKQQVHLTIGRLLQVQLSPESRDEHLFDLVAHLNRGRGLMGFPDERETLARLNLKAGRRAKAALAYESALEHDLVGLELLPDDAWAAQYDLALSLHVEAAEAAYLAGNFERSEALGAVVLEQAHTVLEQVAVYTIRIHAHLVRQQFQEALATARAVLSLLGIDLPAEPGPADIGAGLARVKACLGDQTVEDLAALPAMTDPAQQAAMRILMTAAAPAYFAAPTLFPLIVFQMVELSVRYGNTPYAAYSYGLYGTLQCSVFDDIEGGYPFGWLSRQVQERFGAREMEALVYMNAHTIGHWKAPLREALDDALAGYRSGLETGDLQMGVFSALGHGEYAFYVGVPLAQVADDMAAYVDLTVRYRQAWLWDIASIYHQTVLNLRGEQGAGGEAAAPGVLSGTAYDEAERFPVLKATNSRTALAMGYLCKTWLACVFEAHEEAVAYADEAETYSDALVGGPHLPILTFYASLARIARSEAVGGEAQAVLRAQARAGLERLRHWARHAPSNYEQKAELVAAELASVEGRRADASEAYERAVAAARRHAYVQEEALAFERAAGFYRAWGAERIARLYLQEAYDAYRRWGALAKTRQLERRLAGRTELLSPSVLPAPDASDPVESAPPQAAAPADALDLGTVLKAAQAISGELVLSRLLKTMIRIVIENAGAERGLLILEQDGRLVVQAEGALDQPGAVLTARPIEAHEHVCNAVVNYVAHTGEPVVLDDAARAGAFVADPYVQAHQTRSVLCAPLSHQGRRTGMLYLENNLTTGAFTPARLELLRLLSAEIAVSLENARLYQDLELANARLEEANQTLEQRVARRTAELQASLDELRKAQQQLVHAEKMASLGALTAGIAHEIKNPLNFITGFAEVNEELAEELEAALEGGEDVGELLADLKRNASVIRHHGQRADAIVRSMMAHAREGSGERETVAFNKLVEEHLELAYHGKRAQVPGFTVEVERDYDESVGRVEVEPQEIGRVVLNLIGNAFDAVTEQAARQNGQYVPTVTVATRRTPEGIELRVADNGPGMTDDVRARIFEPFFTTKPTGSGTGLGLSLSYDIVTQGHGGTLTVESRPGEGAAFIVRLPARLPA